MKPAVLSSLLFLAASVAPLYAVADETPASTAAASANAPAASNAQGKSGATARPAEASIPFANHGGIWTWQVENDHSVLIQSSSRKWYRATLMAPCFDLPFSERIGFQTNADGSFDRFGSLTVRDRRCPLTSLVPADPPAKKGRKGQAGPKIAPPATTHGTEPAPAAPH